MRVLVVDDNYISRRMMTHILLQWQVFTDVAENGKVAVEMVSSDKYDLVFMDIMMPELDGYEATRAIRSLEGSYFLNLPIFAFSATPDPEEIQKSKMNGMVSKDPVNKKEIYLTIAQYLKADQVSFT